RFHSAQIVAPLSCPGLRSDPLGLGLRCVAVIEDRVQFQRAIFKAQRSQPRNSSARAQTEAQRSQPNARDLWACVCLGYQGAVTQFGALSAPLMIRRNGTVAPESTPGMG